jgi:hypothetical protein
MYTEQPTDVDRSVLVLKQLITALILATVTLTSSCRSRNSSSAHGSPPRAPIVAPRTPGPLGVDGGGIAKKENPDPEILVDVPDAGSQVTPVHSPPSRDPDPSSVIEDPELWRRDDGTNRRKQEHNSREPNRL